MFRCSNQAFVHFTGHPEPWDDSGCQRFQEPPFLCATASSQGLVESNMDEIPQSTSINGGFFPGIAGEIIYKFQDCPAVILRG